MNTLQLYVESLLQAVSTGVLVGSAYGLMCIGLAMIFSIMKIINFAQGDFMMLGMYIAYVLALMFGSSVHAGPYLAILLVIPIAFVIGYVLQTTLVSRVSGRRALTLEDSGGRSQLILTLGISLVLENGMMMYFGSDIRSLQTPLSSTAIRLGTGDVNGISVFLSQGRLVTAAVSFVALGIVYSIMRFSKLGRRLRASADNPVAAAYIAINVDSMYKIAFALGTCITALAGALIAMNYSFTPFSGLEFVVLMFAGVILGGMGSVIGAFWGGLIIGIIQQTSSLILPTQLQDATIFVMFLLVLYFRPQGLFGRSVERV